MHAGAWPVQRVTLGPEGSLEVKQKRTVEGPGPVLRLGRRGRGGGAPRVISSIRVAASVSQNRHVGGRVTPLPAGDLAQ